MNKTGWWNPRPFHDNGRFHYAGEDRRSLCGKWAALGVHYDDLEEGADDHPDNCAACKKKKAALDKLAKA